jgi:tetratricopeptide (TPR) repeat protein
MDKLNIFISYSWFHHNDTHVDNVTKFAEDLRSKGHSVVIDNDRSNGKGDDWRDPWPTWMRKQIQKTNVVICITSENYKNCFDANKNCISSGGVAWEGKKLEAAFYKPEHDLLIEVVAFSKNDLNYIPDALEDTCDKSFIDNNNFKNDKQYKALLNRLNRMKEDLFSENSNLKEDKTSNKPFKVPFESKKDGAIGIETKLGEVHTALQDPKSHKANIGQVASFQGMGGLGKTQLAVEYAHRYKDEYDGVVWLTVDQEIEPQLIDVAITFGWTTEDTDPKIQIDIAKNMFSKLDNYLLIFDNVEDYDALVSPLIPIKNDNKILLTSRELIRGFESIELETLNDENSLVLLKLESKRDVREDEKESISKLIKILDGLPLALELAGAFVNEHGLTWNEYWELFESEGIETLEEGEIRNSGTNHTNNLRATLNIAKEKLQKDVGLKALLDVTAFGSSEPMSKELLSDLLEVKKARLQITLNQAVKLKYLKVEDEGDLYSMHRLFREVYKDEYTPLEEAFVSNIVKNLKAYMHERKDDFINYEALEMSASQALAWKKLTNNSEDKAILLNYAAYPLYYMGRYKDALILVENAYTLIDNTKETEDVAEIFSSKASLYESQGKYPKAEELYLKALKIREKVLGEEHPDTAPLTIT